MPIVVARAPVVERVLDGIGNPSVRLVLITGDAGIGKSSVLDEVALRSRAARAWGVRSLSGMPLSALAHLVPPAKTRIELIRSLIAAAGPVLCVDDLDACDPLSRSLLDRLTAEPGRTVVATVRTEDGAPPPSLEPLFARVSTAVVRVDPLTRDQSDALVRDELRGPVGTGLLDEVWRRTQGNPLFALQVLRSANDDGVIVSRSGRWAVSGRLPLPRSLRQTLLARLDALSGPACEAAEFLAGLGRIRLTRFDASGRGAAIRELADAGLVTIDDRGDGRGPSTDFAHPLFAEAVWDRTGALRRRDVLAEHLAAERAEPDPDPVRIAVLSLDLDGRANADELMPALRLATGGLDAAVVLRFATATIAKARGDDLEEVVRAEAGALVQLGRVDEALATIAAALQRTRPGRTAVRLALLQHELMIWAGGDQPAAAQLVREQRRRYPRWLRLPRAAFAVAEADGLVFASHPDAAIAILDRDARPWRRMDPELAVARATVLAHALTPQGRLNVAVATLDSTGDAGGEVAAVLRSLVTTLWGAPDEAHRIAVDAHRVASDAGFLQGQAFAALAAAVAARHRGDPAATLDWADRAAAASAGRMPDVLRLALLQTASAQAMTPAGVEAETVAELEAVEGGIGFLRHQLPLARAWKADAAGDPIARDQILAEAVGDARREGAGGAEGMLLHEWIRMGRRGLADPIAALPRGYPLIEARILLARGIDADDQGLLIEAADAFEALGMSLFAAEAAAAASRLVFDQEREDLRVRARRLADLVGAPTSFLLADVPAEHRRAQLLTPREREIASLARNRSSPEIAQALQLSVRTVENHLARAFRKLGISARNELPADLDG